MTVLMVNSVIEWIEEEENEGQNRLERVLWISPDRTNVVLYTLTEENPLPRFTEMSEIELAFEEGKVIKRTFDPYVRLSSIGEGPKKQKHVDKRDAIWEIIKEMALDEPDIYDPTLRGVMLKVAQEKHGTALKDLYKYLRRYWSGGKTKDALIPHYHKSGGAGKERAIIEGRKRGRPKLLTQHDSERRGINIDEDIKKIFRVAIDLYYNTRERRTLKKAYDTMIKKHFNVGYKDDQGVQVPLLAPDDELPSFPAFRYWYMKKQDLKKSIIAREGSRGFNLHNRPVLESSTRMAFGPRAVYQIDSTIADVYLVNRFDRTKIIGRPVIYMVLDVFSRLIAGMYIGLEGPSWAGVMMALANTFESKVDFCRKYGVEITEAQFPVQYLPTSILWDRAKEHLGVNSDNLVSGLGITLSNTASYRADWKGIVEQNFHLLNKKTIHWLPGAINKRYRERGEPDHRLDAQLDLDEFTRIMIRTVLRHNLEHYMDWYEFDEFMIQDRVPPRPIDLWNWGIQHRSGHLREKSPDLVRMHLMPTHNASVTKSGIHFKDWYYTCSKAITEQWFEKARNYGSWKVNVSYDPRRTDLIYIMDQKGQGFERCELLGKSERFKGYRLEEVIDVLEFKKVEKALAQSRINQSNATLETHVEAVVQEAKQQTKKAHQLMPKSKTKRVKNIRVNHSEEKERNREHEAWELGRPETPTVSAERKVVPFNQEESPRTEEVLVERKTKDQSYLEILKEL
ncbi:Mu transposase C-terminal domain-containing protein [Brevibacillus centrosporus]|uniref:Mu transposase C-terminal domain-containing protein n=1 Tax=Brevibacillus centrosporus TaxID=54910 RepID=UPI003B0263B0